MNTLPGYKIDVKTKVCTECGQEKPLSTGFTPVYRSKGGNHTRYANSCKSCKVKGLKIVNDYLKDNPIPKNYKCPICKSTETEILEETGAYQHSQNAYKLFNVDHDHKTDKVRGVICTYCNNMIARSRDNPEILRNGANWLEEKNNDR